MSVPQPRLAGDAFPPGRDALLTALAEWLGEPAPTPGALGLVNIEGFRAINIEFGHETGDRVLAAVVDAIHGMLRPNDRLFRIGADEFAVLLRDVRNPRVAELALERLAACTRMNLAEDDGYVPVRSRAGMALFPEHGCNAAALLRHADAALHCAVEQTRPWCLYDPQRQAEQAAWLGLKGDLETAIRDGALAMHYQPQIDLRTGRLAGGEALTRWHHPDRGFVPPDIFVPLAEQCGLIDALTYWSLNAALRQCGMCRQHLGCVTVAVNLSARILHAEDVVPLVKRAMTIWNTQPGTLTLEVTESAMMEDPAAALKTLQELTDIGVTIAIDDFGTGHSSLAYLRDLPVHKLKIDKSFVLDMANNRHDQLLVRSIIDLAHNFGIRVVAEGVENDATLALLREMGCDYAQGYHIARAMPADDMLAWIGASPWAAARDLP
ncbi:putative bifunctional diguanylate cyclase/phosphodiesterase [Thiohalobacter sp.]|uniref:putative bifunctional diguanylate cyclase/phosphodiesterase n=1 Tax=Thiohalobacter sp. TaxID=2025948 RepID=UPI0026347C22|nr:bifunctional diguanylate cyclase/phosphodiesterase [Thiohalobacter sp.]